MSDTTPTSSLLLYQTDDGQTRVQCLFEDESIWLTQALLAELFDKDVRTINEHLQNIFAEGELQREATIRRFRIVRQEGSRRVSRDVDHYSLPAILAVGFRVRSQRGTQFRQWANARLTEYLVKGFVMDDARLKNPPGPGVPDYFDELLERIRDIRWYPYHGATFDRRVRRKSTNVGDRTLAVFTTWVSNRDSTEMGRSAMAMAMAGVRCSNEPSSLRSRRLRWG